MTRTKPASRRLLRAATLLLLLGTLAIAGCGTKTVISTGANGQVTSQTVPNVHFAKTKFLLHAGLAFGAIHRYIYKPLRAGALRSGAPGRVKVLLKGAAAAIFAVHELKIARDDALSSDLLRPLANKIDHLGSKLSALVSGLKSGSVNPAGILSSAGAAGRPRIREQRPRRGHQRHLISTGLAFTDSADTGSKPAGIGLTSFAFEVPRQ